MFDLNSATVRATSVLADAQRGVMIARHFEAIASGRVRMDLDEMARAAHALCDEGLDEGISYADAADALAWRRESAEHGSAHWERLCLAEGLARQLS